MKRNHHFTPEDLGNLPNMAASFGMATPCTCGDAEIYHNTMPGEDGRCTVYGCSCQHFTPAIARKPAATIQPDTRMETA